MTASAPDIERFDPVNPALIRNPYPTFARYREADQVHWGIATLGVRQEHWPLFQQWSVDVANAIRDPEVFPRPDIIDFRRSSARHLTFGHGSHFCIGSHLARLELRTALRLLAERVPHAQLAEDPPSIALSGARTPCFRHQNECSWTSGMRAA